MLADKVLTADDVVQLGHAQYFADDPLAIADELERAADQGRLADPADTAFALLTAVDICERQGEFERALTLADRAVVAERARGGAAWSARACRAGLLLRVGREEDKAMTDLTEMRQQLTTTDEAVTLVGETLEFGGRAEVGVAWLTEALEDMVPGGPAGDPDRLPALVRSLASERRRLRKRLGLAPDHYDDLGN